jgi:hypothetical protein
MSSEISGILSGEKNRRMCYLYKTIHFFASVLAALYLPPSFMGISFVRYLFFTKRKKNIDLGIF